MIINSSRAQEALLCWRKSFNHVHRGLQAPRPWSLTDGAAMHRAIAYGLAKKDWQGALVEAKAGFDEDTAKLQLLPEEAEFTLANHWKLVTKMVEKYAENYREEEFQVLQPECEFDVVLPSSYHNCVWVHWLDENQEDHWGPPSPEDILNLNVFTCKGGLSCKCWQPHRLTGKTDALVLWNKALWLLEHKSSAVSGETFWSNFRLTIQPTIYIYGIWKHLGLKPNGVLVNLITKPTESMVANWNSKRKYGEPKGVEDYIGYSREAFLRSDEDLLRVEQQMIDLCNEWEWRILNGKFPLSNIPQVCTQYNRLCDYHGMCVSHDRDEAGLEKSAEDYYVDVKLKELLPK